MSKFLSFISSLKGDGASAAEIAKQVLFMQGAFPSTTVTNAGAALDDGSALIYPQNLFAPGQEAYILFVMRDPVHDKATVLKRVALYMPPGIRVNYGANWQDVNMTIGRAMDGAGEINELATKLAANFDAGQAWQGFKDKISSSYESLVSGSLSGAIAQTALYAVMATKFPTDNRSLAQQAMGKIGRAVNPHAAMLFDSVDFRSFEFTFEMYARTEAESQSIRDIIKVFKYGMHPDDTVSGGSYFWQFPNVFDIYLKTSANPSSDYMFNIQTSALTEMSVDYGGSQATSFFKKTGAPVEIQMKLSFTEQSLLTKKRIKEGY